MLGTMANRPRRKKKGTGKPKRNDPRESFHLPVELQLALECCAALSPLPTNKSAVLRTSLEDKLRALGWYPLDDDNLTQLLGRVELDGLSPEARAYLKAKGIEAPDA